MQSNFGFNPSGKRAIITGGARGIGYEFAEQLLSAGAKVCLSDINENVGQDAAGKLRLTYESTCLKFWGISWGTFLPHLWSKQPSV